MSTASAAGYPLARGRNTILAVLTALAVSGWALVLWQSMSSGDDAMGLTMGMAAPLFLAIWVAMMAAMMFPSAAPMILMYARIQHGKSERHQPHAPTWIFAGAYLAVWSAFGVAAYGLASGAQWSADHAMWLMDAAPRIGGGVLIAAGVFQLSPLKNACLTRCRTPMQFVLTSWRDGYGGAWRMGIEHGVYCVGCCWMLFVILFPLGVMNVAAMAAITLLILLEKSSPLSNAVVVAAAAGLIAYGALVVAVPGALPTMTGM